eukprot:TRINITY_DN23_c0_g2_i1.p1 TRINITY_DN23_c0_g2~~TRINITY_DN23_c0_g2_i1.p1  ORF type:complete len:459 (-),score=124.73 TRINITY_DN23_c0_g2_i1:45-1421(-)
MSLLPAIASFDEKIDAQLYDKLNLREVLNRSSRQHNAAAAAAAGGVPAASAPRRLSISVYSNDNRKAFLQGINGLHRNLKFVDCLVSSKQQEDIPCHKLVLAAHSPVLAQMIEESSTYSQDGSKLLLALDSIPGPVLELIVSFMYSGEVSLSDESVVDVFTIANKFGIEDLQRLCEEHVAKHVGVDTVIPFMLDANFHKAARLNERCQAFLRDHMKELLETNRDAVLHLPKPVLIEILKVDFVRIDETEIFKLVKSWGETRQMLIKEKFPLEPVPALRDVLSGLVECIRFVSLPKKFLQKQVLPLDIISEEMMIQILFHKAKDPAYLAFDSSSAAAAAGGVTSTGSNAKGNTTAVAEDGTITPDEEISSGTPLYLRSRGNQWKTMDEFPNEEAYATYMKSVLKPGMRLRALRTYENVVEGDTGEFVQWNAGFPPCQVRWNGYGSTYWLHWRDIVICEN